MPKPDLTALIGGYRKTPVLQIGADIYCDSQLIMRELERRHPTPSVYPGDRGAADALAWWEEKTTFGPVGAGSVHRESLAARRAAPRNQVHQAPPGHNA
jgi:glutathione S-transferase